MQLITVVYKHTRLTDQRCIKKDCDVCKCPPLCNQAGKENSIAQETLLTQQKTTKEQGCQKYKNLMYGSTNRRIKKS